ncbi:nucleotidyltransferase family protein [Xanthobacter autotrophicus]|uniref:nucleotidyltransferase family protein n=1 Tax=Xanthobacter TaxID=279 RepID=UPI0024AB5904|nr:nucleotidyltransferase family protein [Xanthobacter autotrophicus]MDI4664256.1 nucleotidyltransferase family protein [Xanthobacter autotrophicus]
MVLAAGMGTRMRPLTDTRPKPLVEVYGRALIDHVLDRVGDAGIPRAVVNLHHHADMLEAHLKARRRPPEVILSDERGDLLETGGGVHKALPLLGPGPFLAINSDTIWIEGTRANLGRLMEHFDPERMDALLLLASAAHSIGYDGRGDFQMDSLGHLSRRLERTISPFVYAGAAILKPELFEGAPDGAFSLNRIFDKAGETERLFGLRLDGIWMHVGTPDAIALAEEAIQTSSD